jgi:soluble lytic murein transglycosylase-like protein
MTSWGLMQVMGAVAREYGHEGHCGLLFKPEIGLDYGCRHLKMYFDKFSDWKDAVASYNAGSPRKREDGSYQNQAYVDKVSKRFEQIKGG